MFCKKCGNDIKTDGKFCIKCGAPLEKGNTEIRQPELTFNDKWWHRLLRVLYIIAYLPLLGIIPLVWSINAPQYDGYYTDGSATTGSYGAAFWYSLLVLVICLVVLRLIKIAVLYIAFGQRPGWKKEFKKFF